MMRVLLVALLGLVLVPVSSAANPKQPCDLGVASSAANARVRATCVDGSRLAARLDGGRGSSVAVRSDACSLVRGDTFDCVFSMRLGQASCRGVDRVTGRSRSPRLLRRRITGYSCVA